MEPTALQSIGQVIQLAIAPVFFLTGIAGILSVLSQRLPRAVDRRHLVARFLHGIDSESHRVQLQAETKTLQTRTQIIHWAMRLAVGSALVICFVVVCLFVNVVIAANMGAVIAGLFIVAMLFMILSLVLFIIEVTVYTRTLHHDIEHFLV